MRVHTILTAISLAFIITSCGNKVDPEQPDPIQKPDLPTTTKLEYPAPEHTGFERVAYFPSYRNVGTLYVPDYIYESVDVCCYAFATINAQNKVTLQQEKTLKALVDRAHAMGKKVLISLNGDHKLYAQMTSSMATRITFVNSVMDIVKKYDLDGVDNDWEYPKSSDNSSKGNYELMKQFSNILHAPDENKLLTMAITPGKYAGSIRDGILTEVFDCVDWFNIMVYDDYTTEVAGRNHASWELMTTATDFWIGQKKMPKKKFVCGLPAYGRASGITQSGTTLSYSVILDKGGDPYSDSAIVSTDSHPESYEIFYNGITTIRKKVAYCMENDLGGYMFWEQGQDCYTDKEKSLLYNASDEYMTSKK